MKMHTSIPAKKSSLFHTFSWIGLLLHGYLAVSFVVLFLRGKHPAKPVFTSSNII